MAVDSQERFEEGEARGNLWGAWVDDAAVKEGIAGVEEPTVVGFDGDAGVAAGVAGERNGENFWGKTREGAYGFEAFPGFAKGGIE